MNGKINHRRQPFGYIKLYSVDPKTHSTVRGWRPNCKGYSNNMNCCAIDDIENSPTVDLSIAAERKPSTNPVPLCYCFGFDERHLREEIAQTGSTTVPERISRLIRGGLCACDVQNPSGKCCLGKVKRTAARLRKEAVQQV